MQSFEFKPALLRGRNNWTLDSGMLTRNGELYCSLATIEAARFAEITTSRTHSAWLDLYVGGRRLRIGCNYPRGDAHNRQFMGLSEAIFSGLEAIRPDVRVAIGAGGGARWAMFLIGAGTALFGMFMLVSGLLGQVNSEAGIFAVLAGLGAAALGVWMGWSFRPWAAPATLPVSAARQYVAQLNPKQGPEPTKQTGQPPE
jgi:hypothetical protein